MPNVFKIQFFPMEKIFFPNYLMSVGLRLYSQVFSNSERDFECCSSSNSQFFPIPEKDIKVSFFNISLGCTSKFFPIHSRVENWDF